MFNPFIWLDGVLLGTAQKFCDKVQRLTGLTKFTIQKWALVFSIISAWGAVVVLEFNLPNVIIGLLYAVALLPTIRLHEKEEAEFLANPNGQVKFSITYLTFVRVPVAYGLGSTAIVILLSFAQLGQMIFCQMMFVVVWVYFSACIPRPPSKSKMREWYEKVLTRLNESLKPAPALVPIPANNR